MSYKTRSLLFFFGFLIISVVYNSIDQYNFWMQTQPNTTISVPVEPEEIAVINLETDDALLTFE